ncbi:hypothetical protein [uncultured Jannaschia sp.]|uniref:hypothetical protein n=1 Tax=uncultured Jannaschia sp. TaxID=293347 RepID=UPI00262B2F75|nr:hypothetical protein [uncultured Jannaschia sp.]
MHPEDPPTGPDQLLFGLLGLEARAGRLEGAFGADPELGLMWRAGAALTEACRSVGLEDIHVTEGDVVLRAREHRGTDPEGARGAEAVAALLPVLAAPGDLARDTHAVLARCLRVSLRREIDPRDDRDGVERLEARVSGAERAAIARDIAAGLEGAPTPFLGALRAATILRRATQGAAPAGERLVFMAAEHALRGGAGRTREAAAPEPLAAIRRIEAGWIFLPSIALTRSGFRAWQPGRPAGLCDLVAGLTGELDRSIGSLAQLRAWRDGVRRIAEAKTRRSRLRDVIDLVIREPIVTTARMRDMLELSDRAAFTLMDAAAAAGIVRLVTPRRSWRVWARPDMADRLSARTRRDRAGSRGRAADALEAGEAAEPFAPPSGVARDPDHAGAAAWARAAAREAEALEQLDAAMARADAILRKHAAKPRD